MDSDIERALQSAIYQANSAIMTGMPNTIVPPTDKKKKKKKHAREDSRDDTAGVGEGRKEKRRKKVHYSPAVSGPEIDSLANTTPEVASSSSYARPGAVDTSATSAIDLNFEFSPGDSQDEFYDSQAVAHASGLTMDPVDHSISQFGSNDDILKAFQELDVTRIAGALRSLDIPLSTPQSNTSLENNSSDGTNTISVGQTYTGARNSQESTHHTTAASSTVTRRYKAHRFPRQPPHLQNRSFKAPKTILHADSSIAASPSIASSEHNHLLASKWLNASQLKLLVEAEGLVYKKGRFSAIEEQALKTAIENYRVNNGLSQERLVEIIFSKSREDAFWPEITASVPARPITAVYHHVQRTYHPMKCQGKWLEEEDDVLIKAVAEHGQSWTKISEMVGRMPQDCRDRWKNHLAHRSERQRGHWTKQEEEELTRIVNEFTEKQGEHTDNDIFWGVVSQRMGNKRGRQQCRIKWTDCLIKSVKNSGNVRRWNKHDTFTLVQRVASLDVRDDTEIDWGSLSDPDWNLWSAHLLQRRWRTLKLQIKGHESMSFKEISEILRSKHSESPPIGKVKKPRQSPRKEPKSTELIQEDDDDD